ncbi:uncharacterized protein LOC131985461 [Centropristis striata]|uniref:uncharacterized protein LOC131985461 n=1 Tax=Centropristis striata TaxID=184440 RepID=UPI0027DF3FB6|nr:uncharacterized protein LOC131985461 [Centropristis striata]
MYACLLSIMFCYILGSTQFCDYVLFFLFFCFPFWSLLSFDSHFHPFLYSCPLFFTLRCMFLDFFPSSLLAVTISLSQQGLVARCSLYTRHMDSRAVGLLDRSLPGLRAVGDQSYALGHTDTYRLASIHTPQSRSQPLSLPPLFAPKKGDLCSQASKETHVGSVAEACGAEEEIKVLVNQRHTSETQSDRSRRGWSWTVGENCCTAQWVKQKQEHRSTRPW